MSTAAKAHEPTMEEILASIRRIISDDDTAASKASAPLAKPAIEQPVQPPADEALGQDDIDAMFAAMEAPKRDEPEPKVALAAPKPVVPTFEPARLDPPDDLDVLELTDALDEPEPEPEPVKAAAPPPPPPPVAQPAARQTPSDRLLSAATDEAVSNAFGSLANTILANNGRTIDDLVREMLRPMLRSWLDDNLPPLVERLVRQEIERVARGGR